MIIPWGDHFHFWKGHLIGIVSVWGLETTSSEKPRKQMGSYTQWVSSCTTSCQSWYRIQKVMHSACNSGRKRCYYTVKKIHTWLFMWRTCPLPATATLNCYELRFPAVQFGWWVVLLWAQWCTRKMSILTIAQHFASYFEFITIFVCYPFNIAGFCFFCWNVHLKKENASLVSKF